MIANVVSLILTLVINCIVGFALFFGMILGMNGYSGKDAEWGIIAFIIIAGISGILTAVLSFVICSFAQNKWQWNAILAALISIVGFSVVNGVVNFIAIIVAIGIAEAMRKG
ncbi:MAG: hypothetical protein AAB336_09930 [Acidobacteriota bacterium]